VPEDEADNLAEFAETFCRCARDSRDGLVEEEEVFCLAAGRVEEDEDFEGSFVDGAPAGSLVDSFIPSKRTKSRYQGRP